MEESLSTRSTRSWSIHISSDFTKYRCDPFLFHLHFNLRFNIGNIYFNYIRIPQVNISNLNHAHRLGLSDAYMSQHTTNEHIIRVITLYDKLNLDREKIKNGVSIVFYMDNSKFNQRVVLNDEPR